MHGARGHGHAKVPPGHGPGARQLKLRSVSGVVVVVISLFQISRMSWCDTRSRNAGCPRWAGEGVSWWTEREPMLSASANVNHTTEAGRMCFIATFIAAACFSASSAGVQPT